MDTKKEKITSRAALLPSPGDAFLLYTWLNNYENVWRDEIDKLYICINGATDPDVIQFFKDLLGGVSNIEYISYTSMIDHGNALNELLSICKEDYVMLVEDDALIFRKGQVDKCFKYLENGTAEVVGSKRGSCSQEILDKAQAKYSLDYSGLGDSGCNFWPNFFFSSRELLLKTDRQFGARLWKPGEELPGIGIAEADCVGDTFVNTSLQIRKLVPEDKIYYEPQYHGATDDTDDYLNSTNIWSPEAGWLHVGSLSSGVYGLLDLTKDLPVEGFNSEQEKLELERRVAFWGMFADNFKEQALEQQLKDYKNAIERLIVRYELERHRIKKRQLMYKGVLNG